MSTKIDWFEYHEDFDHISGYRSLKMLSIYDHYLSNDEAEQMITYAHVNTNVITPEMYDEAERKYLNLFGRFYDQFGAHILETTTMKALPLEKDKYVETVQNACREINNCTIVLPREKIVCMSTYDLMFAVLFYSNHPTYIDNEIFNSGLFLLNS